MNIFGIVLSFALTAALIITAACRGNSVVQNSRQETDLLTAIQTLFANQPDYMADMTIVVIKNLITQKFAKKEGKTRWEFSPLEGEDSPKINQANKHYRIVVITYPDQTWLGLNPQEKTYAELPESFRPSAPDVQKMYEEAMKHKDELKVIVEQMGTEELDGHDVQKIRVASKGDKQEEGIFVYVARGLKNLLVKMEVNELYENQPTPKGEKMSFSLSNISLDVPDDLFQVPKEYKKVDFNSFMSTIRQRTIK